METENQNIKFNEIDDGTISILIPMKIRKRKGYVTTIVPEGLDKHQGIENPHNYNEKLVDAFAKAYSWQEMIKNEEVGSLSEIAKIEKTDKSHIAKIFKLNYVAPDIIEAILDGKQPELLTLKDFKKGVPDLWEEQRDLFGF